MDLNLTYIDFSIARILNSHSSEMHLHHLRLREEQEPIHMEKCFHAPTAAVNDVNHVLRWNSKV